MALASVSLGWGNRDLCFSDNSKGLKNKEIPGIHLRWDMGPMGYLAVLSTKAVGGWLHMMAKIPKHPV